MSEPFEVFADKLCEYSMKAYAVPYLERRGAVQSYRAKVISKNISAQTMVVQRPYDNQITLPYADSAAYLSAGDECLVLIFGESSNAIVVSDGKLSSLGVNTMVRPNLLDNWFFVGGGSQQGGGQFPINQRGQTSYTGSVFYSIDRWKSTAGSVVVNSDGITVSGSATNTNFFQQKLEQPVPDGTICTLSALALDGTLYTATGEVLSSRQFNCSFSHTNGGGRLEYGNVFLLYTTTAKTASWVAAKLELGDTQTLAHLENGEWVLNELPNYQEQLARCQRHLYVMNTYGAPYARFGLGAARSTTIADFLICPPVPMRTVPTLTTAGSFQFLRQSSTYTGTLAVDSYAATPDGIALTATIGSGTWTTGAAMQLRAANDTTARLIFSAEL